MALALLLATAVPAGAAPTTTTSHPWVTGQGGTLTVGIDQAPTGCNPNAESGDTWADRFVLQAVLPSAFVVNTKDQPVYDSAVITQAELQNTDPETIVYTINPKAVWSDGSPITASDFIYTWEEERTTLGSVGSATPTPAVTAATSATDLPGPTGFTAPAVGYRQIASVSPSNHGRTVTVVFKTPYADWQALFDDLLPAHVLSSSGWTPGCSSVDPGIDLSGGPFAITSVSSRRIVLSRNKRWWEQRPALSRIVVRVASGPSQLATWLVQRKIQVAVPTSFDASFLERVSADPALASDLALSATFLQLDFSTVSPLTASVDMRLAIAHAVDRQSLVNTVVGWSDSQIAPASSHLYAESQTGYPNPKPQPLQLSGQPGQSPPTTSATPTASTPFPVSADLVSTAKLLDGLGYLRAANGTWTDATGSSLTVRIAVDQGDRWAAQSAQLLMSQLETAGIASVEVSEPTAAATGEALVSGAADAALLPMHASPYASQAIAWYTPLLGIPGTNGSQDWTGLDDPTVNNLLIKAAEQLNPVNAGPYYDQVDALLWQEMVALPLFTEPTVLVVSGTVTEATIGPDSAALFWSPTTWGILVPPKKATDGGS